MTRCCPICAIYRDAWKAAGHPGEGEVYLRAPVYVGDTLEQALSDPEESLMNFYRYLGARLKNSANRPGIFDSGAAGRGRPAAADADLGRGAARPRHRRHAGDRCRHLASLQDQLGLAGILAELNTGGLIPHERVMRSMQLLCEKVQPQLH